MSITDDPRPELPDTEFWAKFLMIAMLVDEQLAHILHGFRCAGARLLKNNSGYIMRPEFNRDSLWSNQDEYEQDKQRYLVGFTDKIIECLNRLGGRK